MWGCSVDHLWGLARTGSAPVAPLHLGRKLVWPTALVLRSVGIEPRSEVVDETSEARIVSLRQRAGGVS